MSISIQPCKIDDLEAMSETGSIAFSNDPLNNAVFDYKAATPEQRADFRAWRMAITKQRISGEGRYYLKAVDEANGRLVGYVGLFNPSVDIAAQSQVPTTPAFINMEVNEEVKERLQATEKKWLGDRKDVWYVPSMLVHPDYQGRGIGKRLLQRGLDEADKFGHDVLLEGTTAGLSLYRSCGFEVLEELVFSIPSGGQCSLAVMMRRAKGRSSNA